MSQKRRRSLEPSKDSDALPPSEKKYKYEDEDDANFPLCDLPDMVLAIIFR